MALTNSSKTLLCILLSSFLCYTTFSQSALTKKQQYDSSVQESYRLQYAFLNLSDTDRVADIGTGSGYNLSRIANHFSKVSFTAEDIDSSYCNQALFTKTAAKAGTHPNMSNITFHIGTETSTGLPIAAFTKVLAIDVIHEMTYKKEMLADIKRILQTGSLLLISEILVYKKRKKARTCRYPFLTEPELKNVLLNNGFEILQEQLIYTWLKSSYVKMFSCRIKAYQMDLKN